jgi:hypothetical protein
MNGFIRTVTLTHFCILHVVLNDYTWSLFSEIFQERYVDYESEIKESHWYTGCSQLTIFVTIFYESVSLSTKEFNSDHYRYLYETKDVISAKFL